MALKSSIKSGVRAQAGRKTVAPVASSAAVKVVRSSAMASGLQSSFKVREIGLCYAERATVDAAAGYPHNRSLLLTGWLPSRGREPREHPSCCSPGGAGLGPAHPYLR